MEEKKLNNIFMVPGVDEDDITIFHDTIFICMNIILTI